MSTDTLNVFDSDNPQLQTLSPDALMVLKICQEQMVAALEPTLVKTIGTMERTNDSIDFYPENETSLIPYTPVNEKWRWFLQEYHLMNLDSVFTSGEATAANTKIASLFLPPLLFLKLISFLDDALIYYLQSNNHPQQGSLDSRLNFLGQLGLVNYTKVIGNPLYDLKQMRNNLAHRPTTPDNWRSQQVTLQELDLAISTVDSTLQQLHIVGPRPNYEGYAERTNEIVPPEKSHVFMTHTYNYGVKENGNIILKISHTFDYFRLSASGINITPSMIDDL